MSILPEKYLCIVPHGCWYSNDSNTQTVFIMFSVFSYLIDTTLFLSFVAGMTSMIIYCVTYSMIINDIFREPDIYIYTYICTRHRTCSWIHTHSCSIAISFPAQTCVVTSVFFHSLYRSSTSFCKYICVEKTLLRRPIHTLDAHMGFTSSLVIGSYSEPTIFDYVRYKFHDQLYHRDCRSVERTYIFLRWRHNERTETLSREQILVALSYTLWHLHRW